MSSSYYRLTATSELCGFDADAVLPVCPDEPDDADEEDGFDGDVEAMEELLELGIGVPGETKPHADIGEGVAPGP